MALRRYKRGGAVHPTRPQSGEAAPAPATGVAQEPSPTPSQPITATDNPLLQQLATLQAAERAVREQLAQQQAPAGAHATLTPEQVIASIPGLTDYKKRFLIAHPEFLTPQVAQIAREHHGAALDRGIKDDTPEMDQILLEAVRHAEQREHVGQAIEALAQPAPMPPAPTRRGPPVSAPVSRDAPSMSTGRAVPRTITLTPEQREHARISGVSDAEYARGVAELLRRKALGHYQERG